MIPFRVRTFACFVALLIGSLSLLGCDADDAPPASSAETPSSTIPVTTSSDAARAAFEKGREMLDMGDDIRARPHFREAVAEDPGFTHAYIYLAQVAYSPDTYETNIRQAVATASDKSEGEQLLANFQETFLTNDADRRLALADSLVAAYPDDPRALLVLGVAHNSRGDVVRARDTWARAGEMDDTFLPAYLQLGNSYIYEEPKDFDRGLTAMQKVVSIRPEAGIVHVWLGDAHRAQNDLEQARAGYVRATELNRDLDVAYVKLGHVSSFLGNFDEARDSYNTGVERASGVVKAQLANYRAFVPIHQGDLSAAFDELNEVKAMLESIDVPDAEKVGMLQFTLQNQFMVAAANDDIDAVDAVLEEGRTVMEGVASRAQDPSMKANMQAQMHFWNAYGAIVKGDLDAARDEAEAHYAIVEPRNDPERLQGYHRLMGMIAMQDDDPESAVDHLAQADIANIDVKYHLAQAHDAAGNDADAQRLFGEIAQWTFNSVETALYRQDAAQRSL